MILMFNNGIGDYRLEDDSLMTCDYWVSIEDMRDTGYIELGPYISRDEAEAIASIIGKSAPIDSYVFEIIEKESVW